MDHAGHEEMLRRRFWACLGLSIPVLLYSARIQEWLSFATPAFPASAWISPILAVAVFAFGGVPFLRMAVPELRNRRPGMMTLISLAILATFIYSISALFIPGAAPLFAELVTLITIMLLGHWIGMRSVRQTSGSLDELARLLPDVAERVRADGDTEEVTLDALRLDDMVLVRPGAAIPADGEIVKGDSEVNEAMITGESRPVSKAPGDRVIAGTINGCGSLRLRVSATGDETTLAGINRLVDEAQRTMSRTQVLADGAAGWLFYITLVVAALTAVVWTLAAGQNAQVVERVATVLVIASPPALALAIPLVVAITTAKAARNGILVRDRLALEEARLVNTVLFDKTGTLTRGEQCVVNEMVAEGWHADDALALAAAVEADSEHMIGRAIADAARDRGLELPAVTGFEAIKGRGVLAQYREHTLYVGGPGLLQMLGLSVPEGMGRFTAQVGERGQSVVYLIVDDEVAAAIALADAIRPESRQAVKRLHDMGLQVAMITGDSDAVARAVAMELGIDRYYAGILPEDKEEKVIELQRRGKRVAVVGDGVNDAPALMRADVGIAIGSGTDVVVESAGIILVKSNPLDVVAVIDLSRAGYRKMVQNLVWATGYNVVALPLAAGVLAPIGVLLTLAMGASLMSLSTVIVALNAQLLRRHTIR
jgi:Cu2+-exporting ATPase